MTRFERSIDLTVDCREHLDVRYVTVSGEVDLSNVHTLEAALASQQPHVDMSDVSFFDSAGLRVLIQARMDATEFDLIASRPVRRLMEIANVVNLLNTSQEPDPVDAA